MTSADLKTLLNPSQPHNFLLRLQALEKSGLIQRVVRGIYVTPKSFKMEAVSQKLCMKSYITLSTVLAREMIIGPLPGKRLYAVKIGKKRIYTSPLGEIIHLSIAPHLFFGFEKYNGMNWATPEKALLDTLYFHQKGYKFNFDIYSDINIQKLNKKKLTSYLQKYRNPKFKTFIKGYLHEITATGSNQ